MKWTPTYSLMANAMHATTPTEESRICFSTSRTAIVMARVKDRSKDALSSILTLLLIFKSPTVIIRSSVQLVAGHTGALVPLSIISRESIALRLSTAL